MLSISRNVFDSVLKRGVEMNAFKSILTRGVARNYMPGTNWPIFGGISMSDGNIEIPKSVGPLYSCRKEKCGVIVINNQRVCVY